MVFFCDPAQPDIAIIIAVVSSERLKLSLIIPNQFAVIAILIGEL
jgi:hypothetical protein